MIFRAKREKVFLASKQRVHADSSLMPSNVSLSVKRMYAAVMWILLKLVHSLSL